MTNFSLKNDNGIATAELESYPTELENSWIIVHKMKDHRFYAYMFCMYKNNDMPIGTIINSPYFYHRYPYIHSLYCHIDKELNTYFGVSGWVHPKHRKKGWWSWYSLLTRVIFWGNFKIYVDAGGDRDRKMENLYQKVTAMINQKNKTKNDGRVNQKEIEMQRDVASPHTWYNHRIGGKIEKEDNET